MEDPPLDSKERRVLTASDLFVYMQKHRHLQVEWLTGEKHGAAHLNHHAINRPGMNLFGFFKFFAHDRIQVFGRGEHAYLEELCKKNSLNDIEKFFSFPIPFIVFSHRNRPSKKILDIAEAKGVAVASTTAPTLKLIQIIHDFFDDSILVKQVHYGVMMEIYGSGVFIQGPRGIGKSECALELLERGHRFVADDVINIKRLRDDTLIGYPSRLLTTHMEFKGIGIVNVAHLFGVRSILKEKAIELVITLEDFDEKKEYDVLGEGARYQTIFDVNVPMITLPVRTASNIPILIETVTMNERLKRTGYDPAKEFNKRIMKITQESPHPVSPRTSSSGKGKSSPSS